MIRRNLKRRTGIMKTSGNTILITGGGSGIGETLAHRFHDAGNRVIIAGRRAEALERAAAGRANISTLLLDVSDAADVDRAVGEMLASHPDVNVLVNNAGIMRWDALNRRGPLEDAEAMVATNVLGPIRLTNALVEHLQSQADAAIINVTSGLAFLPLVPSATYSATKAALHSYTVSLRAALKGKVEVIEVVPPAVQTELTPGQSQQAGYQPLDEFADEVMSLFAQQPTPPEILVERVHFLRFAEAEGRFERSFAELQQLAAAH
jgi:uncharacterized oxidoreductase